MIKMKIGMYTEDEIFEYMTGGNGVRFLGRSMYDAIFDKIHALITENEQLKNDNADLKERYNNTFECHCNRVQVEKLQNNWNELKKWCKETIETVECTDLSEDYLMGCEDILKKMQELEQGKDE